MTVKAIKLVTGEDIIAEIEKDNDNWTLKNPVQVSMVPNRTSNQPTFGFIPFPLTSNEKSVTINSKNIMFEIEPAEEFLNQYNSLFGSGIVTPPKGLII